MIWENDSIVHLVYGWLKSSSRYRNVLMSRIAHF
jgi:hypothetical protein